MIAAALDPSPPGERDLRADPEGEAVGGVQALEGAYAEVLAPVWDRQLGLDGECSRLHHLELHVQGDGGGHAVKTGAEVRR